MALFFLSERTHQNKTGKEKKGGKREQFKNQEIPVWSHLILPSFYTDKNTFFNSLNTYYIVKHYTVAGLGFFPPDSFTDHFQNRQDNMKCSFKIYIIDRKSRSSIASFTK